MDILIKLFFFLLALTPDRVQTFLKTGTITLAGHALTTQDIQVMREFGGDNKKFEAAWDEDLLVVVDVELTEPLKEEGIVREVINRIQRLRKRVHLKTIDAVETFYDTHADSKIKAAIEKRQDLVLERYGQRLLPLSTKTCELVKLGSETSEILRETVTIYVFRQSFAFNDKTAAAKVPSPELYQAVKSYFLIRDYNLLLKQLQSQGKFEHLI